MDIITERLVLHPLTPEELSLWTDNIPELEKCLCCRYSAEPMEGIFKEIVKGQLPATLADSGHYEFHSFWFLIRKTDNTVIGSADFKDTPDADGCCEIGYGLGREYEHMGYMTEAVRAMCSWALSQPGVAHIIAETNTDGYASGRILTRCGFRQFKKGSTIWWSL